MEYNNKKRNVNDWKSRIGGRVLAVNGSFKGRVLKGWFEPNNGIFHLQANYWCENAGEFRVDCLKCGGCPKMADVIRVPAGVRDEDAEMELVLKLMKDKGAGFLFRKLLELGFSPEDDICFRMPIEGDIVFNAVYRGKGKLTIVGEDGAEDFFAKDVWLNTEFDDELPVIYGGSKKNLYILERRLANAILAGLIREWCRFTKKSLKTFTEK